MERTDPVSEHYARLLARRYVWMLGGAALQRERNAALVERLDLSPRASGRAVDLGGGPGFFASALARRGFEVELVDTSPPLLERARREAAELPVRTHLEDLCSFLSRSERSYEVVACLGDTLTHLPHRGAVARLARDAWARLDPGGKLILSFRELSSPPEGLDRFIPVRADDERVFLCFLEAGEDHVQVHDLVYERAGGSWELQKSSYPKLIVPRAWITQTLEDLGFSLQVDVTPSGVLQIVGAKNSDQ